MRFEPIFKTLTRREELTQIIRPQGICIELGVAEGHFSEALLDGTSIQHLYSVDMYGGDRGQDTDQYRQAVRRLMPYRNRNTILRMRFDEAVHLFANEFFDLIYVDGYAHTGEEDGHTFQDWLPKLRRGAVIGGHDYCASWPLVVKAVDAFIASNNLRLFIVNDTTSGWNHGAASWFAVRPLD